MHLPGGSVVLSPFLCLCLSGLLENFMLKVVYIVQEICTASGLVLAMLRFWWKSA